MICRLQGLLFLLLLSILSFTGVNGFPQSQVPVASQANQLESIAKNGSTEGKVVAVIAILVGAFVAFTGYKLFKAALFISGFILFADITLIIMTRVEPSGGYANRDLLLLLVPAGVGLIGGFIAYRLWRLGLTLIGALGGATCGAILLNLGVRNAIQSDTSRLVFIIAFAILGAIIIHFIEKPVIIGSTALVGSYTIFIGIDTFANTGFNAAVQKVLFAGSIMEAKTSGAELGMVAGVLVTFGIAVSYQFKTTKNHKHRD